MTSTTFRHEPVLPREVLSCLLSDRTRRVLDATVGGGGHAALILAQNEDCRLVGVDRDRDALAAAEKNLAPFEGRFRLRQGTFRDLAACCAEEGWDHVDAVLFDVGVSSYHLDSPERGFSHRTDGPLDMRMDRRSPRTAAQFLNTAPPVEIARVLREYGEERCSRRIARAIVQRRKERPWARTGELAEMLERILGRRKPGQLPPATRTFQALRIAVNDELNQLRAGLEIAVDLLAPGGRLVVISFHSLEDRIVKRFMRYQAADCICPPRMPECRCGKQRVLKVLTRKPLRASEEEMEHNRRASSARLRAAEKLPPAAD